jgi:hypothetical protein
MDSLNVNAFAYPRLQPPIDQPNVIGNDDTFRSIKEMNPNYGYDEDDAMEEDFDKEGSMYLDDNEELKRDLNQLNTATGTGTGIAANRKRKHNEAGFSK